MSSGLIRPQLRSTIFFWPLEERHLVPRGNLREAGAVLDVRGEVVPVLDLAQSQVGGNGFAAARSSRMPVDIAGLHPVQDDQRLARASAR